MAARQVRHHRRRILGVAHLDEQRGAGLGAGIDARAVDGQITKEEHIPGFGRAGHRRLERILVERQMPTAVANMRDRAVFVTAVDHADTTFFERCIIKMHYRRNHAVVVMRKEGLVLVHREGRALLGRLNEQLVVVQLHIGRADDLGGGAGQPIVEHQATQLRRMELHVVAVEQRRLGGRHGPGTGPGGVDLADAAQTLNDGVRLGAERGRLLGREHPLDQQVAMLTKEINLGLCQHTSSIG